MTLRSLLGGLALATAATVAILSSVNAAMDEPVQPKIDCTKPINKDKPACAAKNGQLSDDQIYNAAYWHAKNGSYKEALTTAALAQNADDPRILRVTGFATRKLGDVDGAMPYYQKALAMNPADTRTRQYMGEALISKGDMAAANVQLSEIEKHCGKTCEDYAKLAQAIAEAGKPTKG